MPQTRRNKKKQKCSSEGPSSPPAELEKKRTRKTPAVKKTVKTAAVEKGKSSTVTAEGKLPAATSSAEEELPVEEETNEPAAENTNPAEEDLRVAEGNEEEEESSSEEEKDEENEGGEEEEEKEEEEESDGRKKGEGEDDDSEATEEEVVVRNEPEMTNSESDNESDMMAIKPLNMCFPTSEYKKQIKVGTRCMLADAIKTLESLNPKLNATEKRWFEEHPQFKHLFHMQIRKENHRVQGMWMMLLRIAVSNKKKEVWSVVNGVPIRYGLRKHALISGLNCRNYPMNYQDRGSMSFVNRHFKGESKRLEDVKQKLLNMGPHKDRLKMTVLFFLGSVVCAQTNVGKGAHDVLDFFQRAVDDLDFCKTFPWGRENVNEADNGCPLMCHSRFKKGNRIHVWNVSC